MQHTPSTTALRGRALVPAVVAAGTVRAGVALPPAAPGTVETTAASDRDVIVQIDYISVSVMSSPGRSPPRPGWTAALTRT